MSWRRALGWAGLAVYGPFVLMAVGSLIWVSCDHCQATAWKLLPIGPGLLPVVLTRRLVDIGRYPEGLTFAIAAGVALLEVVDVAWVVRRSPRWRVWTLGVGLLCNAGFAYATLMAIRA
jgi:hypothetical protein